jgi:hypothetical protein
MRNLSGLEKAGIKKIFVHPKWVQFPSVKENMLLLQIDLSV